MLTFDLTVTYFDGSTATVEVRTPDLLAFESHFDKSFTVLSKDMRLGYLVFLAWHAIKRTQGTELDMESWADTISLVEAGVPKE